jgi:hypothetical protein
MGEGIQGLSNHSRITVPYSKNLLKTGIDSFDLNPSRQAIWFRIAYIARLSARSFADFLPGTF